MKSGRDKTFINIFVIANEVKNARTLLFLKKFIDNCPRKISGLFSRNHLTTYGSKDSTQINPLYDLISSLTASQSCCDG